VKLVTTPPPQLKLLGADGKLDGVLKSDRGGYRNQKQAVSTQ
jgi:hypothetical protein